MSPTPLGTSVPDGWRDPKGWSLFVESVDWHMLYLFPLGFLFLMLLLVGVEKGLTAAARVAARGPLAAWRVFPLLRVPGELLGRFEALGQGQRPVTQDVVQALTRGLEVLELERRALVRAAQDLRASFGAVGGHLGSVVNLSDCLLELSQAADRLPDYTARQGALRAACRLVYIARASWWGDVADDGRLGSAVSLSDGLLRLSRAVDELDVCPPDEEAARLVVLRRACELVNIAHASSHRVVAVDG